MVLFQVRFLVSVYSLGTMHQNLQAFIPLLSDEKNILLFPLFPLSQTISQPCISEGNCSYAYSILNNSTIAGNQFHRLRNNY